MARRIMTRIGYIRLSTVLYKDQTRYCAERRGIYGVGSSLKEAVDNLIDAITQPDKDDDAERTY